MSETAQLWAQGKSRVDREASCRSSEMSLRRSLQRPWPEGLSRRWCSSGSKPILRPERAAVVRPDGREARDSVVRPGKREARDSVGDFLRDRIRTTGPVTVAEYMRLCLTAPSGYYASRKAERILGDRGDFITSPELGQLFGELLGVWTTNELYFMGMAPRRSWNLVELGPGSGLLMADMLRVLKQFSYTEGLSVHLVEVSSELAETQMRNLCGEKAEAEEARGDTKSWFLRAVATTGVPVYWHRRLEDVPKRFAFHIAHEFFDALPVHYFQRSEESGKWAEVCVDVDDAAPESFRFVLSARETVGLRTFLPDAVRADEGERHWETSPDGLLVLAQLRERVVERGGAALVVDYGHEGGLRESSLRGFHRHALVSPLQSPGQVDLTADVNFAALKSALDEAVLTFGPLPQADFLANLGADKRQEMLLAKAKTEKERAALEASYRLMTSPEEMGQRFKAMALFPATLRDVLDLRPGHRPSGFVPLQTNPTN